MPALYLLPSTMADGKVTDVLPARAIEVARTVRHFVVENIRTARRFLKRLDPSIDISALSFTVLDEHTAPDDIPPMLAPLAGGEAVAVVSEAGCPAIADPGADLVAAAQRRGYKVVPLVGPSSIILSLMASGFNGQSFAFSGYLPVEPAARSARLKEMTRRIRHERQTQIFIETPYRNRRLVEELVAALPPRCCSAWLWISPVPPRASSPCLSRAGSVLWPTAQHHSERFRPYSCCFHDLTAY